MNLEHLSWVAGIVAVPVMLLTWFFKPKEFASFCKSTWPLLLVIFLIAGLIVTWVRGWFSWLAHPATLPLWLVILLFILLFVFGVLFIAASLKKSVVTIEPRRTVPPARETSYPTQPTQPAQLDWHSFVSDEIFGVLWRWSYVYNRISDTSVIAFCPRPGCMNRLEIGMDPQNPNIGRQPYSFPATMGCHRCGFKHHFDCDENTLRRRVMDEIERLINTGQYVQRMTTKARA